MKPISAYLSEKVIRIPTFEFFIHVVLSWGLLGYFSVRASPIKSDECPSLDILE
jgi:hypothetical protein